MASSEALIHGQVPKMDKKKIEIIKKQLEQRREDLRTTMAKNAQDGREAGEEERGEKGHRR